jgi:putative membrane protein
MRTIQPIAFGLALALAACGGNEPAKSAFDAPPAPPPATAPQANTGAINDTSVAANPGNAPTSADVPHEGPNAGNPVAAETGAAETQAALLTDDQMLEVTHVANGAEVEQAKVALMKTKDARIRKLAQMMVRDHTRSDAKGEVVAKKANLTRSPSSASESLATDADGTTRSLKTEDAGNAFDDDYVGAQIREHQSLLDTLDHKLIPAAKSDDVKAYLVEVRAAVASHLQHAKDLQKELHP